MLVSMTPFTTVLLVAAACVLRLVEAVPLIVSETRRDVADPPVTAPNASTVWVVGETQTVVWDTSNLPQQITNTQGTILLGFVNDTTGNEHLMIDSPLASNFDIRSGSVDLVVPDVESRTDYIIALLGDSGNISENFTIKKSSASSASSAAPSTTSSSVVPSATPTSSPALAGSQSNTVSLSVTSTSLVIPTVTTPVSLGTLTAQTSASGSASAAESTQSTSTSAAFPNLSCSRLACLVISALCVVFIV